MFVSFYIFLSFYSHGPPMTESTTVKKEQHQHQLQQHGNNNNSDRASTTHKSGDPSMTLTAEVDLNTSYRSGHSLDSSLSSERLNSSGDTSYHSALQSPVGGDDVREPGETTGLSASMKRELSASLSAEQGRY